MGGSLCKQADYNPSTASCDRNGCQPFAVVSRI